MEAAPTGPCSTPASPGGQAARCGSRCADRTGSAGRSCRRGRGEARSRRAGRGGGPETAPVCCVAEPGASQHFGPVAALMVRVSEGVVHRPGSLELGKRGGGRFHATQPCAEGPWVHPVAGPMGSSPISLCVLYVLDRLHSALMRVEAGRRAGRLGRWPEVVLAVLLAILVHLLACAHGPVLTGGERADSIAALSTPSCDQPPPPLTYPAGQAPQPGGGGEQQCVGGDEPSVQAQRGLHQADAAVCDELPGVPSGSGVGCGWHRPPPPHCSAGLPAQQKRACLGVWRT